MSMEDAEGFSEKEGYAISEKSIFTDDKEFKLAFTRNA